MFPVKESDYDYAAWTTNVEDLRACNGVNKSLKLVYTCKCSN